MLLLSTDINTVSIYYSVFVIQQLTGQPVLIGGTMGTCRFVLCLGVKRWSSTFDTHYSYVLTGTNTGFQETFGSTCHGAVSVYLLFKLFDVYYNIY